MDIWQWINDKIDELVETEHHRLAYIMAKLPGHVVDDQHEQVDIMVQEGLVLAKSKKEPWIELYLKHWELQSRVFSRMDVNGMLPKAVDLLDFAHQPETADCPQGICAVQDLAQCYACIDGPGYYQQRLDVAEESLAKIDASWPCYTCIAAEKLTALNDAGLYQQALEFSAHANAELLRHQQEPDTGKLLLNTIDTLLLDGQYPLAYEQTKRLDSPRSGDSFITETHLIQARTAILTNRLEQAVDILPAFALIERTHAMYTDWCEATMGLVQHQAIENTWQLGVQFFTLINKLLSNGVVRKAIQLAFWHAELALLRNAPQIAQLSADLIPPQLEKLAQDLGAKAQYQALLTTITTCLQPQDDIDINDTQWCEAHPEQTYTILSTAISTGKDNSESS
ncbi:MAG: hypothetical protein HOM11_15660, partial [Methylococcales bacterium]|nr:hypothetical protein [Methylococcales bacterium]